MRQERPVEPVVLRGEAEEARKALQRFDSRLDFWWCDKRCRWKVMEFTRRTGHWSFTFYWQGPNGEYRGLLPIAPILARLREIDWNGYALRFGMGDGFQSAVEEDMGTGRRRYLARRKAELERHRQDYVKNVMSRAKDFMPGTGGAKLRAYEEARKEAVQAIQEEVSR